MNHLANEKSPYLLQHAANPVAWYPWGNEAFERARSENRPIFLSVGYATCHWCHVMAHESFEDEEVAALLNQHFVAIKVDREERPDIDQIYMTACQAMTRGGGWPLSVFLTPDGKPFFAGTYYPKRGRMQMVGFMDLLSRIAQLWERERPRLLEMGEEVVRALKAPLDRSASETPLDEAVLERACRQLGQSFDPEWGGFGPAPKFPVPHNLTFLTRWHRRSGDPAARRMVEGTLRSMRRGGVFDQIGFGFHRYSVDERWLVPHFEKMLYDQAQLAMAYLGAFQAFREPRYAEVAREIFSYVLHDLTSPEGAFFSAEDADSQGREGLFYVWTPEQVKEILGPETGGLICRFFGILPGGNFEDGLSIPHLPEEPAEFAAREKMSEDELAAVVREARGRLLRARGRRERPLRDDKVLTAWNGLMIAALARGSQALGERMYAEAARRASAFVLGRMTRSSGRLFRRHREGETAFPGYLDDYAFLVWGLIELYESTLEIEYLEQALIFQESTLALFSDETSGGFFFSGRENETLIVSNKDAFDHAVPSGNSVAAMNLLRLGRLTGNSRWEELAEKAVRAFSPSLASYPVAHTQFLAALEFMLGPSREIVIAGDPAEADTREMIRVVQQSFQPNQVLLLDPGGTEGSRLRELAPYLGALEATNGKAAAYLCERHACRSPIRDAAELARILES